MNQKFILNEEIRQMDIHKWLLSEKCGYNLGDWAYFDWIKKYAEPFRIWAMTIPDDCICCGLCSTKESTCSNPFNNHRIQFLTKSPPSGLQ